MKRRMTVVLVLALAVVALAAVSAWATGTPAGTIITNTATLNYKDVNGNAKQQLTAFVETTVLTKRGVDVTPDAGYTVTTEDKVTEYAFTIRNTGNAEDTIALAVAGSNTDPGWSYEILVDGTNIGVWDPTDTTITETTGVLAPDTNYYVIVRVTAPPTADYNATNTVTLTATGSPSTDGGSAAASDTGVITLDLSSANVTMTKIASTYTPVPLAHFTYTITVTNSDPETPAYNVVMTDILDTDLAYVSSVVSHGSITAAPAVDASGTITWTIGTLAADTTATLTLTVYVKEETPQGNAITNTATLAYEDSNGNDFTDTASSDPGTTQELADVSITTSYTSPSNVDPGDYIAIPFTVTNDGNGTDSFNLSYTDGSWTVINPDDGTTTTTPIVWIFYTTWTDDGDGIIKSGELSGPVTSTGDLPMNGSVTLYAATMVPTGADMNSSSSVTITATSTSDTVPPLTTASLNVVNNVVAPVLTLDKKVNGLASNSAQPGETLTYTLTIVNTGDGVAYNVVLVDGIPANTTYVPGSITVGGVAQSDVAADDYADYNVTNAGAVTVTLPTIAPNNTTIVVTFQVKIN